MSNEIINQDDASIDAVLSYLNQCFDISITPATYTDVDRGIYTVHPQPGTKWRLQSEILIGAFYASNGETLIKEMDLILSYLLKKELIIRDAMHAGEPAKYCINFEGRYLIKRGGFIEKNKKEINDAQNENQREYALMYGTWVAGLGAVGLLILEILKRYHWMPSINLFVFLIVFLLAVIMTTITILLIQHLLNKQK